MNVLVIGSGAREHAIVWKLRQSTHVKDIYVAPGNAGTATLAHNLPIPATAARALAEAARSRRIDLTFVGPEAPLAAGIVDHFQSQGLMVFGPSQAAARIESSKVFAKDLMLRHGIPCARSKVFDSYEQACKYIDRQGLPIVVKADGLAAGKGVTVAHSRDESMKALHDAMVAKLFGAAGRQVIVEECLDGPEVSVFAFTDGEHVSPLAAACDYKRAHDGDRGPNTGGMGSYSPPTFWDPVLEKRIRKDIMEPTVRAMSREGYPYRGVLYGGLMLTREGPKVLEFNCRLGDPETQVVLPRLKSDLFEAAMAVAEGNLSKAPIVWVGPELACVGVVLASGGYPGEYQRGLLISGSGETQPDTLVFHAGTKVIAHEGTWWSRVITDGGRVLTVVGMGASLAQARSRAYERVRQIEFEGRFYRSDIAARV